MSATPGRTQRYPFVCEWVGRCTWNRNARGIISQHKTYERARMSAELHRDLWHAFFPIPVLFWTWRVRDSRDGSILAEIN